MTHSVPSPVSSQCLLGYSPQPHLALAEPRAIAEDETGLGTISFSLSANTDGDTEERETLWEYSQHLQEPTGIFHGVPGVTPAKIFAEMSYREIP